jgi:hypothetical protein
MEGGIRKCEWGMRNAEKGLKAESMGQKTEFGRRNGEEGLKAQS